MRTFFKVTAFLASTIVVRLSPIENSEDECDVDTVVAKNNECISKYPDSSCSYIQCMESFVSEWDYENCKKTVSEEEMAKLDEVYKVYDEKDTECREDDEASKKVCIPRDIRNISGHCSSRYEGCEYVDCTVLPSDEYMEDCELKYKNQDIDESDYKWLKEYVENMKKQKEECNGTTDDNKDEENSEEDTNTNDNNTEESNDETNTNDNKTEENNNETNTNDNNAEESNDETNTNDNNAEESNDETNTNDNNADENNNETSTNDNKTEESNDETNEDDTKNECSPKDLKNISGQCSSRYEGCEYIECTFIPDDAYIKDCEEKYSNKEISDNDYQWIQNYVEKVNEGEKECKASGDNNDEEKSDDDNAEDSNDETNENSNDQTNSGSASECDIRDLRNIHGQCSSRYEDCEYLKCTFIPSEEYIKDCEQKYNNKEIDDNNYLWLTKYLEDIKQQEEKCNASDDEEENNSSSSNSSTSNSNASDSNTSDSNTSNSSTSNSNTSNSSDGTVINSKLKNNNKNADTSDATKLTYSLLAIIAVIFNVLL